MPIDGGSGSIVQEPTNGQIWPDCQYLQLSGLVQGSLVAWYPLKGSPINHRKMHDIDSQEEQVYLK